MKKVSKNILIVLIKCLVSIYEIECAYCPVGWKFYLGNCYTFSSTQKNITDAAIDCSKKYIRNPTLSIPNSADEFSFIKNYMTISTRSYLIGIYDYGDKNFSSFDNSTSFQTWCSGEPKYGAKSTTPEACATIQKSCGLADVSCSNKNFYSCEAKSCETYEFYNDTLKACVIIENGYNCSNAVCDTTLGLSCNNGICSCANNYMWTGSKCELCPDGWKSYGSSCYHFVSNNFTYSDALSNCQSKGYNATLAIPNSVDEFSFLNKTIESNFSYFIGVYDFGNKNFYAIDNSTIYLSWCSGEPNNGAKGLYPEPCVNLSNNCGLNDCYCTNTYYSICEFKK